MRKTLTDLYDEYSQRYNGKPKHSFSHFIRVMSMIDHHKICIRPKIEWWGYKHISGTYQAKRYFEPLDIQEAKESPFCEQVVGPFLAEDREEALYKVKCLTD